MEQMKARGPRREDERFVAGLGRYVDDISNPNQLYLTIARSPVAHAEIKRLNTDKARKVLGVVAVVTATELQEAGVGGLPTAWRPPGLNRSAMLEPRWPVLAQDRVRYCGEAIAAVVAESRAASEEAASLIEASIEERPAVAEGARALEEDAPIIHSPLATSNLCLEFVLGDAERAEAALSQAAHVIELQLRNNRVAVCPMEPRALLAEPGSAGTLTLYTATQVPHSIRGLLARVLRINETLIRVISPDVGGGFGGKMALYPEDVIACFLALKTRRPV